MKERWMTSETKPDRSKISKIWDDKDGSRHHAIIAVFFHIREKEKTSLHIGSDQVSLAPIIFNCAPI